MRLPGGVVVLRLVQTKWMDTGIGRMRRWVRALEGVLAHFAR